MATGPEHYREAQRLVERAKTGDGGHVIAMEQLAAAQVHATLALAAANGLNDHETGMPAADALVWAHTVSVNNQDEQPCPRCHCFRNCECDLSIPDEDDMRAERDYGVPVDDDPDED